MKVISHKSAPWLGLLAWASALMLVAGVDGQVEQAVITNVETGNRKVSFDWTRVRGDSMTQEERVAVPRVLLDINGDTGVSVQGIRGGNELLVRGAGARNEDGVLTSIRVGNQADLINLDDPPDPDPEVPFEVTGAFQFGPRQVGIAFSEPVDPEQAVLAANYVFAPSLDTSSLRIQNNGSTVIVTTASDLLPLTDYSVFVSGVESVTGRQRGSLVSVEFSTIAGTVIPIADLYANAGSLEGQTVTVVGQVFYPLSEGTDAVFETCFLQDASARGIRLALDLDEGILAPLGLQSSGNVVAVTATVGDPTGSDVSLWLTDPSVTLLSSNQPQLGALRIPIKAIQDPKWEGTYIEVGGKVTSVDATLSGTLISLTDLEVLFGGYRIWRARSDRPQEFSLLRTYSLLDTTWTFEGDERTFLDPDSLIARGAVGNQDFDKLAGPFNGVGYLYAVTWFDAENDGTAFPPQVTVFERTGPEAAVRRQEIFPNSQSRASTPLLERVKVVPNPYMPSAAAGKQAFPGPPRVQFINLPNEASVTVYSVSGDIVAELEKELTGTDNLVWDLRNQEGEEIAPGMYLFYVRAGAETKVGRFVIGQ